MQTDSPNPRALPMPPGRPLRVAYRVFGPVLLAWLLTTLVLGHFHFESPCAAGARLCESLMNGALTFFYLFFGFIPAMAVFSGIAVILGIVLWRDWRLALPSLLFLMTHLLILGTDAPESLDLFLLVASAVSATWVGFGRAPTHH